ncbi:MAG TPA: DsbA family protein, partial [Pyrinomonadaceae bacterium]
SMKLSTLIMKTPALSTIRTHAFSMLNLCLIATFALSSVTVAQTRRRTPANRKTNTQQQQQPATQPATSSQTQPTTSLPTERSQQSADTNTQSNPTRPTTPPTPSPIPIVIINGQTLSTSDLDPASRQQLESVEQKLFEARKGMLELQINNTLLDVEAKKRRIDTHRLYDAEVRNRVPTPTPAQIKKFIDDNRSQFEGADPVTTNQRVAAYLQDEAESKLADDLVKRLRQTIPVVMGVDVNSPNLADSAVLATVGGQPLKAGLIKERLKPVIYQIQFEAYSLAKRQADQMVDNTLLLEEARKRQIGPEEIIRAEVSDKVRTPTEAEVAKFYSDNKARINGDLNSVRNQIAIYLRDQDQRRLERELSDRLRTNANVRWLISEPAQPVQNVSVDDDPSRGNANAPVTVVEFTDFQCPACAAMHPVLEEVLKSYGDKVRFVVRDFPLGQHEHALKAAEAANAANEQGKFFEYIALLFQRQKALDVPSLKKYASELGLNRARFDAALDRGVYAAEVQRDIEDGEVYGVGSTPTIFVNGVQLKVLSADGLREAIERAMKSAASAQPPAQPK